MQQHQLRGREGEETYSYSVAVRDAGHCGWWQEGGELVLLIQQGSREPAKDGAPWLVAGALRIPGLEAGPQLLRSWAALLWGIYSLLENALKCSIPYSDWPPVASRKFKYKDVHIRENLCKE